MQVDESGKCKVQKVVREGDRERGREGERENRDERKEERERGKGREDGRERGEIWRCERARRRVETLTRYTTVRGHRPSLPASLELGRDSLGKRCQGMPPATLPLKLGCLP